ncbi:adenylate kinase family protein, partial [Verrucomicrobiota bacterium]
LYMFDGFPRTIVQADLLKKSLVDHKGRISHVIFLDATRDVLIRRLTGRRTCRKCGSNYHIVTLKSKKEGVCDACGGELYQRTDDQEATIMNRLNVYNEQTESLVQHYQKQGLLVQVDADRTVDEIADEVISILNS